MDTTLTNTCVENLKDQEIKLQDTIRDLDDQISVKTQRRDKFIQELKDVQDVLTVYWSNKQ